MSKPQIKFTKYTANRADARPYTRLDALADPNSIQTLTFEEVEEKNDNNPEDNIAQDDEFTEPMPMPAPMPTVPRPSPPAKQLPRTAPKARPVTFDDVKRAQRQPRPQPPQAQPQPQSQAEGISSGLKWLGGIAIAGVLYVALGNSGGKANNTKHN